MYTDDKPPITAGTAETRDVSGASVTPGVERRLMRLCVQEHGH